MNRKAPEKESYAANHWIRDGGALAPAMALGLVMTSGSAALATGHRIQIYEIYYNPPGPDTHANFQLNREWVQLHNTSGERITLTGWTLRGKQDHVYKFGTYKIKAYVKIHTGKGTSTQTDRYWGRSWYVWNNTGDQATLKDNNGNVIDRCSYIGGGSHNIC
jgi:Lamin Tail Domain